MIYFFSKIFTYIFLPPGIFIAALFAAYVYAKKFKKIFLSLALLFWFLSTDFAPYILLNPLESKVFKKSGSNPVAVVVLGGGEEKGVKSFPTMPGATERILKGMILAYQKDLPLIYTGCENLNAKKSIEEINSGFNLGFSFGKALKPKSYIIEGKSKNTYQNAKYTKELFKRFGIENPDIYLVTSAYHMPRSYKIFNRFGFKIIPVKTDYKVGKIDIDFWSIFPKMKNLRNSYLAIHEYFGLLSLILRF